MSLSGQVQGDRAGTSVGPYVFTRRLGTGGMGEVWEGRDRRLDRDVALKVVRSDLLDEPIVRERFLREARMASAVSHPYVATVLDVVEDGGETVLVMERVEGRSLQEVIRGPDRPPLSERIRYGAEIAEALAAIHARGILHRDLKPGNVLVTRADHVKVLDFGIALRLSRPLAVSPEATETTEVPLTLPGMAVGTVAYMAPEQIRGEPLDRRTDVFTLGILLCELATSHHPFRRDSLPRTVGAILEDDPFTEASGTAVISPPSLRPIIARALSKSPRDRPSDAAEIAADLQAVLRGETARAAQRQARGRRRRLGLAAGVAAALLLATAAGVAAWLRTPPTLDGPRVSIAFPPLEDRTGLPDGSVRASMVADLLATELASSRLVRPVGPQEAEVILAGMGPGTPLSEAVRAVSGALKVDYVARGVLYREGDRFVATLEAVATRGGPVLASLRADGPTASEVAASLARSLRRALPGIPVLAAVRDAAVPAEPGPVAEEVRLLYERARLAYRDGRLGEAIEALERALAADPRFARGHALLARVRHEAGYGRLAREAAGRARGLAPAGEAPAAARLRLTLEAVRAEVSEDAAAFVAAAERLAEAYGDEPETQEMLAEALDAAGRRAEALVAADRALRLDPTRPSLRLARARILAHAERWDEALAEIDRADRTYAALGSGEGQAGAEALRGKTLMGAQRHEEAIAALARAVEAWRRLGRPGREADAASDLGAVHLLQGRPGLARALLESSAAQAQAAGKPGLACAIAATEGAYAYLASDYGRAEALLRQAVDQARQLQNDELLLDPLSNLTSLLTYVGRYAEARTFGDELLALVSRSGPPGRVEDARLNLLNLDLMQGRLDEAVAGYGEILAASASSPAGQGAAWARLARAEILQARGRLTDALADADAAVATFDTLGAGGFAGYARLRRGLVRLELARPEGAAEDLGTALREADGLPDLAARARLARQFLPGPSRKPGPADQAAIEASPVLAAWADAVRCEALLERGDAAGAERTCRRASEAAVAQACDAAASRAARAEALARLGRRDEAREEARRALEEAARLGLPLPAARAAAALVAAGGAGADAARERGRSFLADYLAGVPPADRDRVSRRRSVARLAEVLGHPGTAPGIPVVSPGEAGGVGARS